VRVVTIKHPPAESEGIVPDNNAIGQVVNVAPQVALLMIAAGWARGDTRSRVRRQHYHESVFDRRHSADRRSGEQY